MAGILNSFLNKPEEANPQEIVKPSVSLIEWDAPEREFKKHPREYYRKIAVIVIFVAAIALVMTDFILMLVIGVVFFVVYVFHTIPPRTIHHRITSNGVDYGSEHLYKWSDLKSFYIEKPPETEHHRIIIDTVEALPGRLILLLDEKINRDDLSKTLNQYISIDETPEVGILDKLLSKISRHLNI
jgi:hypothetical protein